MQCRWLLLCWAGWCALTASARADVGFAPRFDLDLHVCFENLDDYPEYDFYLKYGLSRGRPLPHLLPMRSGVMTKLEGQGDRFTGAFLLAMPRGTPAPVPADEKDWLHTVPPGAIQSGLLREVSEGIGSIETTYRVRIDGNRLVVEHVGSRSLGSRICWVGGGICLGVTALAIGLAAILIWLRRSRAHA
jgi:hypothetical protein